MRYAGTVFCFCAMLSAMLFLSRQNLSAAPCPCDIYATGGTPCVAAHSTVRALYSAYNGPLYQVRRTSDKATRDITPLSAGGIANSAIQDSFLGTGAGTISIIYDQSPKGNHLKVSPAGCWITTPDIEANAKAARIMVGGHWVYGMKEVRNVGYRCPTTKTAANGVATGNQPESMYWVINGKDYNAECCFDYGNAETSFCGDAGTGTMEALYFGTLCWFSPCQGSGPWMMADLEAGLFAGGPTGKSVNNTPITFNYATGMLKGNVTTYTIKAGDAQTGVLKILGDGNRPAPNKLQGNIILGIGGDNSNLASGTFYEGAITWGRAPDSTENAVQANIVAAGYGSSVVSTYYYEKPASPAPRFKTSYNPSNANALISYSLQDARLVSMNIFDQQGRRIAAIVNNTMPAGSHTAVWDTKQVPAGVYICRVALDGLEGWSGKITVGK